MANRRVRFALPLFLLGEIVLPLVSGAGGGFLAGSDGSSGGDFASAMATKGESQIVVSRGDISASERLAVFEGDKLRLLQIGDGSRIVQLIFGADDDLSDCDVGGGEKADELRRFVAARRNDSGFTEVKLSSAKERSLTALESWAAACETFHTRQQPAAAGDFGLTSGKRRKRAMIPLVYPGTKWCGRGNRAESYDDLGERKIADSCCRVHDHCPKVIQPMATKFNYFNYRLYTVSHCDCDSALRKCLKRAIRKHSDTVSQMIGHLFFNVVAMPCFVIEDQDVCAERSWWGTCIRTEKLAKARISNATRWF